MVPTKILPQGETNQIQNRLLRAKANAIRAVVRVIAQAAGFAKLRVRNPGALWHKQFWLVRVVVEHDELPVRRIRVSTEH
jgi:hypothetical protein